MTRSQRNELLCKTGIQLPDLAGKEGDAQYLLLVESDLQHEFLIVYEIEQDNQSTFVSIFDSFNAGMAMLLICFRILGRLAGGCTRSYQAHDRMEPHQECNVPPAAPKTPDERNNVMNEP